MNAKMRKAAYMLATAAMLTACGGNQNGYTVSGTVEGGSDGETVYLQTRQGRDMVKIDSAVIANGKFSFKGAIQDSLPALNYVTYKLGTPNGLLMPFFIEKGNITVALTRNNDSATGTPANDTYQVFRTQENELNAKMNEVYAAITADSTLTKEQRAEKQKELSRLDQQMIDAIVQTIEQNADNVVGMFLLKSNYYQLDAETLDRILKQVPAAFAADKQIIAIKEKNEMMKQTAVGQAFTDFEMQTPDGKTVKLSDYVGKGKWVLVDFWASWCGPCRREMPNLVDAYKKYKNKGFEIVGVSLDRDAEAWKKGIADLNITWPQMSDLKFWDCEGAKLYAVSSIPHTVLIDGKGIIVARGLHGTALLDRLKEELK